MANALFSELNYKAPVLGIVGSISETHEHKCVWQWKQAQSLSR